MSTQKQSQPNTTGRQPTVATADLKVTVVLGDPKLSYNMRDNEPFNDKDLADIEELKGELAQIPGFQFHYVDNHASLVEGLRAARGDLAFNLCDEGFNNEGSKELHVPALLEMLDVPYTGAGPNCLAISYDKAVVRALAGELGIPVPWEIYHNPGNPITFPQNYPALVKPNFSDGSLGITREGVVHDQHQLTRQLEMLVAKFPNMPFIIQEYLDGTEYSVGILGNPGNFEILPLLEVDYSKLPAELPRILSYEYKWLELPEWDITYREADLPDEQTAALIEYSTALFERLGCRDYARFDFRMGADGKIKLLEANPNPGLCGEFMAMAKFANLTSVEVLKKILHAAKARYGLV